MHVLCSRRKGSEVKGNQLEIIRPFLVIYFLKEMLGDDLGVSWVKRLINWPRVQRGVSDLHVRGVIKVPMYDRGSLLKIGSVWFGTMVTPLWLSPTSSPSWRIRKNHWTSSPNVESILQCGISVNGPLKNPKSTSVSKEHWGGFRDVPNFCWDRPHFCQMILDRISIPTQITPPSPWQFFREVLWYSCTPHLWRVSFIGR